MRKFYEDGFCFAITHPLLIFLKTAGGKISFRFFIGLEDGDRLTVFFNRTDWFQRTGWLFWIRIINGFLRIWSRRLSGMVFHRDIPKKEEVDWYWNL